MNKILIKNATVLTVNEKKDILENADILIVNDRISKIGNAINENADEIIDAKGKVVLPGFIQTHVHLCQTLFRGLAENRTLLPWLREKIWPLEARHTENSTYYSAALGIGELISSGTTTILDMGSVNHTDKIFEAIKNSGIRAMAGKAMMDSGTGVPENILETTDNSIKKSMELYKKWNNSCNGRIKYAFAPRFILSVSENLLKEVKQLSEKYKIPVHTHAYENKDEGSEVKNLKGAREFEYFNQLGMLNEQFLAAHCVWTDKNDMELMQKNGVKVIHCPSSNFKLGSGMLNLKPLLDRKINVSIGADGAPCNNKLSMLQELRTSALMQNVINKPGDITAYKYIELATIEGAKALGLENEIGSLEAGKKADLIIMDMESSLSKFHAPNADIATKIIYTSDDFDIKTVIIDGKIVMKEKILKTLDEPEILKNCKKEALNICNI